MKVLRGSAYWDGWENFDSHFEIRGKIFNGFGLGTLSVKPGSRYYNTAECKRQEASHHQNSARATPCWPFFYWLSTLAATADRSEQFQGRSLSPAAFSDWLGWVYVAATPGNQQDCGRIQTWKRKKLKAVTWSKALAKDFSLFWSFYFL